MGPQVIASSSSQTPTHPSELEKNKTNPPSKLTTLLLSPKDLQNNSSLLQQLRSVINEAYKSTHLKLERDFNVPSYSIFPGFRLDDEFQLIRELPEDSRLAIMFDEVESEGSEEDSEDIDVRDARGNLKKGESASTGTARETKDEEVTTNGTNEINNQESLEAATSLPNVKTAIEKKKKLIAVASIKPWQGSVMSKYNRRTLASSSDSSPQGEKSQPTSSSSDIASGNNTQKREELLDKSKQKQGDEDDGYWNWEIATCACVDDTKYRRMGIVSKLIELLLDELKDKRRTSSEISTPKIKLWVSALGGSYNVEYWQKRGFTIVKGASGDVGPDTAPPGVWGNAKDIQIWTLNKVLVD